MADQSLGELFVTLAARDNQYHAKFKRAGDAIDRLKKKAARSDIGAMFKKAGTAAEGFGRQLKQVSSSIAQAGAALTALGAGFLAAGAKVDKTIAAEMQNLKNAFTDLAVEVGRALLPAVREMANGLRRLADWFANLSPQTKRAIGDFAVLVVKMTLVAGVVSKVAGLVGSLGGVFKTLGGAISKAGGAGGFLKGIGVALVKITAAVLAFVGVVLVLRRAWIDNWGDIQGKTQTVVEFIGKAFLLVAEVIKRAFSGIVGTVLIALGSIVKVLIALQEIGNMLPGGGNALIPDIPKDWGDKLTDQGFDLFTGEGADKMFNLAKSAGKAAGKAYMAELEDLANSLGFGGGGSGAKARRHGAGSVTVGVDSKRLAMEMAAGRGENLAGLGVGVEFGSAAQRMIDAQDKSNDELAERMQKAARTEAKLAAGQSVGVQFSDAAKSKIEAEDKVAADAAKRAEDAAKELDRLKQASMDAWKSIRDNFIGKLGQAGNAISAGMQGAQAGPWGAIVAVVAELLTSAEQFTQLIQTTDGIMIVVADAMGAILEPLDSLAGATGLVLQALMNGLGPMFEAIAVTTEPLIPLMMVLAGALEAVAPVLRFVGTMFAKFASQANVVFKGVFDALKLYATIYLTAGEAILNIAKFFANVWNAIVDAISSVLASLGSAVEGIGATLQLKFLEDLGTAMISQAANMKSLKAGTQGLDTAIGDLRDGITNLNEMTWEDALAAADLASEKFKEIAATKDATKELNKFAQAFLNVPTGFKYDPFSFFAQKALGSGGSGGGTVSAPLSDSDRPMATGGIVTRPTRALIGEAGPEAVIPLSKLGAMGTTINVTIVSDDPRRIWRELKKLMARDNFLATGNLTLNAIGG